MTLVTDVGGFRCPDHENSQIPCWNDQGLELQALVKKCRLTKGNNSTLHLLVSESAHCVSCPLAYCVVGQMRHQTALILDSKRFLECLLVCGLRQLAMA